ncbi:MAG TPA: undecaprenyl-diphosphate phosphatase [Planctomycetota bacterium]|nr:undecaprenyl-diphosphate phosphatase [Planctomycetota bacterium]
MIAAAIPNPDLGLFDALVLGLVEGLTEFLPISSTGHLLVAQRLRGLQASDLNNVFVIGIQMGAITAILVLYWRRLLTAAGTVLRPTAGAPNLLLQIAIAAAPAALLGLFCGDWIEDNLFTARCVAATMIAGGLLLLVLEWWEKRRTTVLLELEQTSYRTALWIGFFQCLALVPGTSRSAAMIGGALVLGLSRTAAAEFSFLVGLPILFGASSYRLLTLKTGLEPDFVAPLMVGTLVAFASALVVVRPFVRFLRHHTFAPFAWYRLAGGVLLALLCLEQVIE